MDFDEAVLAHIEWKKRLFDYLIKRDGSLDPAQLEVDNRCELGCWIYGEASQYSRYPEHNTLRREHARFHKAVRDVVRGSLLGLSIKPEILLGTGSEFGRASTAVVTAISALKGKVASVQAMSAAAASGYTLTSSPKVVIPVPAQSIDWDPSYSVEVAEFDEHHQYLFCLINILREALQSGKERPTVRMVLGELADYVNYHFAEEEALMEKTQYPELGEHRLQHQAFVARVANFQKDFDAGMENEALPLLEFLKDWIVEHIRKVDRRYSEHMKGCGIQ